MCIRYTHRLFMYDTSLKSLDSVFPIFFPFSSVCEGTDRTWDCSVLKSCSFLGVHQSPLKQIRFLALAAAGWKRSRLIGFAEPF